MQPASEDQEGRRALAASSRVAESNVRLRRLGHAAKAGNGKAEVASVTRSLEERPGSQRRRVRVGQAASLARSPGRRSGFSRPIFPWRKYPRQVGGTFVLIRGLAG